MSESMNAHGEVFLTVNHRGENTANATKGDDNGSRDGTLAVRDNVVRVLSQTDMSEVHVWSADGSNSRMPGHRERRQRRPC